MPQTNVEKAKEYIAAYNRRDFDAATAWFDPSLEWVLPEHVDCGDRVATRLRYFGRGKGSGLEIETEMYHQVATFRDGRMVRLEYVGSWPEALAAVGGA